MCDMKQSVIKYQYQYTYAFLIIKPFMIINNKVLNVILLDFFYLCVLNLLNLEYLYL